MKKHLHLASFLLLMALGINQSFGQSPGLIVRPAGGPGSSVLNPNQDGYASTSSAGFTTSDISQSEVIYKIIPPLMTEPTGDLATGPNGGFSDIVKTVDGSGCYMYNDGANLMIRIRIGAIVNGAKAYNILIDTDNKLGDSGPNADPNFVASTNNGNGNPGFEIEIAFETGNGVVIYNVDGIVNPSASNTYTLASNTMISVALSRESNDADYFYDFYVPLSALNALGMSNSSPFRIITSTNTNPGSAFQGTRSDIYGINDANFPNTTAAWQFVAQNTPTITLNNLTSGGSGFGGACTSAPSVNTGIGAGTNIAITGSWTRLDASKPSTATISVYNNGTLAGTTTCASGATWSYSIATVSNGDVISAKAMAAGESMCLVSNSVSVTSCTPTNVSTNSTTATTCMTTKGIQGTKPANAKIKLYTIAAGGNLTLYADDATTTYKITYNQLTDPTGTIWEYNGSNNGGQNAACTGGPGDLNNSSFAFSVIESGKCESAPSFICLGLTQTAAPVITQTTIYPNTTTISGTAVANSTVRILVNGFIINTTTATGGAYSFSNTVLQPGDQVSVLAQSTGQCISNAASISVNCFTSAPVINTDNQGNLLTGTTTVTGFCSEAAGTTIRLYQSPSTLLGSSTVQTNGTWSITVAALTGGVSFYATAQNGTCSVSANSSTATTKSATTACPTITGTPYSESATAVSGSFSSAFTGTVYLYQDDSQIGSAAVSNSTAWTVNVSTPYSLYADGVLKVGAQATNSTLNRSCPSTTTVTCSAPTAPSVSPTTTTIGMGQTATFTVSNSLSGVLYTVQNTGSGTSYASSQFGNGSTRTFTTVAFPTSGTYNLSVVADKLTGSSCKTSTSATVIVNTLAPLSWLNFTAQKQAKNVLLKWITTNEVNTLDFVIQQSDNGKKWNDLGNVTAAGNSTKDSYYSFLHILPATGLNYYRVMQRDKDGQISYSKIVRLDMQETTTQMTIYPNPIVDGILNIDLKKASLISIYNNKGALMLRKQLNAGYQKVDVGAFANGLYNVHSESESTKFIIK